MKLRWAASARRDRNDIALYIRRQNPGAAARMDQVFADAAARLIKHPMLGRPGKIPGTRELIPHENYRVIYQIDGDTVSILAVVHTARQWPPQADLLGRS